MKNREDKCFLEGFTHVVTTKDVPMLKRNLEFEVSFGKSFVPPIKITFFCDEITTEEWQKDGDESVPKEMPCYFNAELPEGEHLKIRSGTMEMTFSHVINKTIKKFFEGVLKCKNRHEAEKLFISKIHLDKIKSLTKVYERKTITEKTKKVHGNKKR